MPQFIAKEKSILFDFLLKNLTGIKRTKLKGYLAQGRVFVNGQAVSKYDFCLKPGDCIEIEKAQEKIRFKKLQSQLSILFEDDCILAIDKPAGLLSIATEKVRENTAYYRVHEYLKTRALAAGKRPLSKPVFIVHRLDRETSGILLFAKNLDSKLRLQNEWSDFEKRYFAVVEGRPNPAEATLAGYLKENQILRIYSTPNPQPGAKHAVTHYRTIHSDHKRTLLEIKLETGRKHQIRVHLSDAGHPIAGDEIYGIVSKSEKKIPMALHAFSLEFRHPATRKWIQIESPLPPHFKSWISLP